MIFDSHAHYDDERFDGNRDELLREIHANGVSKITNASYSLKSCESSKELSEKYDFVYCAAGIHPSDAVRDMQNKDWLDIVESYYTNNPKCVAIGEIGLDYYYGKDDTEGQKKCFVSQMELAKKLCAPVIIHDRDAHEDTLKILESFPDVRCVVHSFSGSFEMAREVIKRGHYISVNGVVTFKNAKKIVDIVERFRELGEGALDRLLVETDCPYLTPVPFRGQTNRSDYIKYTSVKCGELLKITPEEFCKLTYNNAMNFYGIK